MHSINIVRVFFMVMTVFCIDAGAATPLSIDDPVALKKLDESGLDISRLVFGSRTRAANNQQLNATESYKSLAADIARELDAMAKKDSALTTSMGSGHRLFNKGWLTSKLASYELVGIVNRVDRTPFTPDFCGEVRFIYRLAYRTPKTYSRLPMTVNAVFGLKKNEAGCSEVAKKWQAFAKEPSAVSALEKIGVDRLKTVEVNLQAVRWPSTVRPDMGGYAEYLMKVFAPSGAGLVASTLENTPDVEALLARTDGNRNANGASKKQLREWIEQNLAAIDNGVAVLPANFLAKKAVSVALAGNHRLANAPYSRIFTESDFAHLDFSPYKTVKSAHGLMRRLNDLTCVGCHQGRTVAGFHFLGKDGAETIAVNAIHIASSPHFLSDRSRREKYFESLIKGEKPDVFRNISVRGADDIGEMGSHCGLGDPSFASWTCAPGYKCAAEVTDSRVSKTGVCMPVQPRAGSICQTGKMKHDANPLRDRIDQVVESSCGSNMHCEDVSVGFPGGMCSNGCETMSKGDTCGSIAILQGFNTCLSRGKDTFAQCLQDNVRPGSLQMCNETKLCRDDFICARVGRGGGCIPPYFLFQLRVDGHPSP